MSQPRVTKAVLRKPVDEDDLAVMAEDKLVLEEKSTQVPMKCFECNSAGVKQPFHQSKRKEKSAVERLTSESLRGVKEKSKGIPQGCRGGKKILKDGFSHANQSSLDVDRKKYVVEMDEDEYENLEAFRLHTCTPECEEYFSCKFKDLAAESHFKGFMERTLGRYGPELVSGLYAGYIFFRCFLSDEEVEILKGEASVKVIELWDMPLGHHC